MNSSLAAQPVLRGNQRPRILSVPPFTKTTGREAVDLARMAGLDPDPWQEFVITQALGEIPLSGGGSKWAALEVGVEVARQNGKGGILEIRELAGLFLLRERLIIHSAHEFATSLEAFHRLLFLIESTPDLKARVKRVSRAHGDEGIELHGGQRIRFKTRTKGGGRGFSCDCLILDEAMAIPEAMHGALLPTLSARPNPQVWLTGSAVDQDSMEHGRVFARLRERAIKGNDPALAYFGFSPAVDSPDEVTAEMAEDPQTWAQANPGLGIRISLEHVAREQRSMDPRTFAVERLGVGDWPSSNRVKHADVLDPGKWRLLADKSSKVIDPVCFVFDVTPSRASAAIGVAGERSDGLDHVEVIDRRPGTDWVVKRLIELNERHQPLAIACDQASPAMALVCDLENAGIEVRTVTANEHAQACGVFFDSVEQATFRHVPSSDLDAAVRGVVKRSLGDAWAWSRKTSTVDISPLVVVTLALWLVRAERGSSTFDGPLFSSF